MELAVNYIECINLWNNAKLLLLKSWPLLCAKLTLYVIIVSHKQRHITHKTAYHILDIFALDTIRLVITE